MVKPRDENFFSTLPRKSLFARLKVELRDFKAELTRPTGHLRPVQAPKQSGEGLFERLWEAAREFKARPLETLSDLFSPDVGLLRPRAELAKFLGASAVVHALLLVVLLYTGALVPLLSPEDADERRRYEVTMLAPQKLPPAPWRIVETPDIAAGPEAFVTQTPANVPSIAPAPAPVVPRRRIVNPSPGFGSQPSLVGGEGAEATPTPTTGASPQPTPSPAGSTRNANGTVASASPTPGSPASKATPAPGEAGAESPNYLGDAVGGVYAKYVGEPAAQPSPLNFSVEADFKVEADGKLSDQKITAPPAPPVLFEGMQQVLGAAGEARSFQNLSKLCTRNGLRLETDDTTARLTVRCTPVSKEFADATAQALGAVVRDALVSVFGSELPEVKEGLSVAPNGDNVEAVLTLPRERAAEIMRARFAAAPTP